MKIILNMRLSMRKPCPIVPDELANEIRCKRRRGMAKKVIGREYKISAYCLDKYLNGVEVDNKEIRHDKIVKAFENGLELTEIAHRYNCTKKHVQTVLIRIREVAIYIDGELVPIANNNWEKLNRMKWR